MWNQVELSNMGEECCELLLKEFNKIYREGNPKITDLAYDKMMLDCAELYPENSWFNQEEVEPDAIEGKTVKLPQKMLSTNKAYSISEIKKWAENILDVAKTLGITEEILFRVTPKLDGYAAYFDSKTLYTRGNGVRGTDITRAIDRGLVVSNKDYVGPGEIVVLKEYFKTHLSDQYENSRNIIAGVIKEGELDDSIKDAILDGAIVFKPFAQLNGWQVPIDILLKDIDTYFVTLQENCHFDTDGLVIEVIHDDIKTELGSTNHHNRWQISLKKNEEFHDIEVTGLVWQTSKNGRLTPVVQLTPTKVSGVIIAKATGHHAGNVAKSGIGKGAIVRVCRSGLVIPYIESVIKPVYGIMLPGECPSCKSDTYIIGDNLMCSNTVDCPTQIEKTIEFYFKTIGNCDGFGPKIIEQLCLAGYNTVHKIYQMEPIEFDKVIGGKTAINLVNQIENVVNVEDWRFLAAWSLNGIGKGMCEKLLQHHKLEDVFDLTVEDITRIDGFAEKSATSLIKSLTKIIHDFEAVKFISDIKLIETPLLSERIVLDNKISGKTFVITGTLVTGKRNDMYTQIKNLGGLIGSAVSVKTDYLVCGGNVGATKKAGAEKFGVKLLTEVEFLEMLK